MMTMMMMANNQQQRAKINTGYSSGHLLVIGIGIWISSSLVLAYAKWTTKLTGSTVCCFWVTPGRYSIEAYGV